MDEKRAQWLSTMRLEVAQMHYSSGVIGQVEYEAYRRAWAMGYPEGSHSRGWLKPSWDAAVEELAARILAIALAAKAQRRPYSIPV